MNRIVLAISTALIFPVLAYSQVNKYRAVQVDSVYWEGSKSVTPHRSYPNLLVGFDLDKDRITVYKRPSNNIYELSDWRQLSTKADSVIVYLKAKGLDENNEECNVNIYRYKNARFDLDIQFLYSDKGVILHLKEIEE